MKTYICISNKGEVDVRAFKMMGMTTKGGSDKIGKFGTGNKYAIACLLREGLDVFIAAGEKRIFFLTKKTDFRGEMFNQIFFKENGKNKVETTMTTEMGRESWGIKEALREFVSNAIDEGDFQFCDTTEIKNHIGRTSIYVEMSEEVRNYFTNLDLTFLYRAKPIWKGSTYSIYPAIDTETTRIYRRGVLIYEMKKPCLWYYEFENITLPETRIASQWDIRWEMGAMFGNLPVELRRKFLQAYSNSDMFESLTCVSSTNIYNDEWEEIFTDSVVVNQTEFGLYADRLIGKKVFVLPSEFVAKLLDREDIQTISKVIGKQCLSGWDEKIDLDEYESSLLKESVLFLQKLNYDVQESEIHVANNKNIDANMGQYIDGRIYINYSVFKLGLDQVIDTIAHEMFHKISGQKDETRSFESYLINECLYHMKKYAMVIKHK